MGFLKLDEDNEYSALLFSDDALVIGESEISGEPILVVLSFLMIRGYPFIEETLWGEMT